MAFLDMSKFEVHTDPFHLLLALFELVAAYLTYLGMRPPNPRPTKEREVPDFQGSVVDHPAPWTVYLMALTAGGIGRVVLAIVRPVPSELAQMAPGTLLAWPMEWPLVTLFALAATIIGYGIRVRAYGLLGRNFTFQISRPRNLVRGGMYRYVQHPSYTGMILGQLGIFIGAAHSSAGLACFAPAYVSQSLALMYTSYIVLTGSAILFSLPFRVRNEEDVLRKEFGKEWEEYNRTTPRLIPGIY